MGLKQGALKTIYIGGILPLLLCGAPVWKNVMNKSCYKAKLIIIIIVIIIIKIQRLINIRLAKAYRADSNEELA